MRTPAAAAPVTPGTPAWGPASLAGAAGDLTLEAYLETWLAHAKSRVRARTHHGYGAICRRYICPALGDTPLPLLHPWAIQQLYSSLTAQGLSGGTVLNIHLVLTQALSQAVRWGLLGANPAHAAQPPRPRRAEPETVSPELAARILREVQGSPIELVVAIALGTGMRRGEILGLRWADLDSDLGVARVRQAVQVVAGQVRFEPPKTRRSRRAVALPAMLAPHLRAQREDQRLRRRRLGDSWQDLGLVCDRGDGAPMHPDTVSAAWRRLVTQRGLPHVRFHDLRHAHATLLLAQGIHPKVVSERLGHASIGITLDTYSHVLPTMQSEAAEAIDELLVG